MSRALGLFDRHKKIATQAYFRNTNNKFEIVDVRTREEYENEHISGALLVPLNQLKNTRFHAQPDTTAVFHCHSGRRTQQNQMELRDWAVLNGFKDVRFMIGGIEEWKGWGFPTVVPLMRPKPLRYLAT
ncbi:MAG: hypothetical protein A3F13_10110 [Gammaproteobacteria bacterium RIFCSPHIGHO2_12_FULL_40_19]|nr:MAG: hypothetical protein A3F13_10110 [Gammaproteobacteria bacterium RIFCSPHIGHO2_12_FULL_40_19]